MPAAGEKFFEVPLGTRKFLGKNMIIRIRYKYIFYIPVSNIVKPKSLGFGIVLFVKAALIVSS